MRTREIVTSNGKVAIVDEEDWPLVSCYRWHARRTLTRRDNWYAITGVGNRTIYMHRLILPSAPIVDHRNRNGLDNRRDNLRPATNSLNIVNAVRQNKTGYRGVDERLDRPVPIYRAQININKTRHLGPWRRSAIDAAIDYDKMALVYHGEFAILNIPEEPA